MEGSLHHGGVPNCGKTVFNGRGTVPLRWCGNDNALYSVSKKGFPTIWHSSALLIPGVVTQHTTHVFWNFKKTPILRAFKDNFWKINPYFTLKQGSLSFQKHPYFYKFKDTFQKKKYSYLWKNKDIIQRAIFSNLICPPLTYGQFNDFRYENLCIIIDNL